LGAGIAFAEKYNKTGNLCICYFGDGAIRQGAFHEALNMAMSWKLPVIFVVENNGYAMGTSVARSSNVTELYTLGEAYDIPSEPVDGMSVEAIHEAVGRAAERARNGEGPTFLEFRTYRYRGHSMSDPQKYRSKEEVEEYKHRDPIEQIRAVILENQLATEEDLENIDKKVKEIVAESVQFAEESEFPDPKEAYTDVYVENDYPFVMD
jgi:pyruvate dehydrogenase E1 component alpha subunit